MGDFNLGLAGSGAVIVRIECCREPVILWRHVPVVTEGKISLNVGEGGRARIVHTAGTHVEDQTSRLARVP